MSKLASLLTARPALGRPVQESPDLLRVAALPRREQPMPTYEDCMAETARYSHPGGKYLLRPVQAAALLEIRTYGGLLGLIGVGRGKTIISALAGEAAGVDRTVLLVPASLRDKTLRDFRLLHQHFSFRDPVLFSYEEVSGPRSGSLLRDAEPQLIVADEAHALKHLDAARTKRFMRFFADFPETRLVAMSGTLTSKSIEDFATLALLALAHGAPVPIDRKELHAWAEALDVGVEPLCRRAPGALAEHLCLPGESARAGFQRRLVETPGVIATVDDGESCGLEIQSWSPKCPQVQAMVARVQAEGTDPDGNELADPVDLARVMKCVVLGFWYRWCWPGGVPDLPWLEARNAWARATRFFLSENSLDGLDSPALLARACEQGKAPSGALARAWKLWAPLRSRPEPPVEPAWFSTEIVDAAESWAREHPEGIVWCEHVALVQALASRLPAATFPAGVLPPAAPLGTGIVLSRPSHGVGKNLQAWHRNLFLGVPSSGEAWEQALGRTHRPGQLADTVQAEVLLTHPVLARAFDAAREAAEYIQTTTGNPQKLCLATYLNGILPWRAP